LSLLFTLLPDKAARFDNAVFSGATTTKATQLARDIRFAAGQPFTIELVEQTIERLRSRDYIAQVLTPGPQLSNTPGGSDSVLAVTIPFVITDRSGLGLDGAVAMERSGPGELYLKGNLEFSLLNLLGIGDKLHLTYEGDRQWQRLEVALGKAYIGPLPLFGELGFGLELANQSYAHLHQHLQLLYELQTRWQVGIMVRGQESAVESTLTEGVSSQSWKVYATELVVKRIGKPLERDVLSSSLLLTGGSGFVSRQQERHTRWLGSFSAQLHLPLPRSLALRMSSTVQALLSDEPSLTPAERYRVGGARTVRGYSDNQFAFRNTAFGQFESLWYLTQRGALFAFVDGGAGMRGEPGDVSGRAQWLLGYGMGIRMPSKIGTATIAWARSREDGRSLGRVHLRFQNRLADEW
jgi:outer membrane protein assembly factor BamA